MLEPIYQEIIKLQMMEKRGKRKSSDTKKKQDNATNLKGQFTREITSTEILFRTVNTQIHSM